MLVSLGEILASAQRNRYAVGAFNLVSLETGRALLDAAQACDSPIILMIGEEAGSLLPYAQWMPGLREMAVSSNIPVAISLDHGSSIQEVERALNAGVTGVMYDGSLLPFDENTRLTNEVVRRAHAMGVSVEAEIGHVGEASQINDDKCLTNPADAEEFSKATHVDALAVAIGTAHGKYRRAPQIDLTRLEEIRSRVSVPLVLHGGSGTPPDLLKHCVQRGICKVNIYTDLVQHAGANIRASLERGDDIVDWLRAINAGFCDVALSYLELLGSAGQAR